MNHTLVWSNYPQRSPEWFAERVGYATGSKAPAIVAQPRKGQAESATRRNYLFQIALETLTGKPQPQYDLSQNAHIQRGQEGGEEEARKRYVDAVGSEVIVPGFAKCVEYRVGCSLDGVVEDFDFRRGILEIKRPLPAIHTKYLMAGGLPSEYRAQVMHNLFVDRTAEFCDFVSHCAEMPPGLDLYIFRVERAEVEAQIDEYRQALFAFLTETQALTEKLKQLAAKRLEDPAFDSRTIGFEVLS